MYALALTKQKSILIIAPSLIAESLSLKLTSLDNNLNILLDKSNQKIFPDLIIWNILDYESEDLLRLELVKLKERWPDSQVIIVFSTELEKSNKSLPYLNSEGLLLNPSVEKVLQSIDIINNGGRVFDIDNKSTEKKANNNVLSLNQRILTSGLKQIDKEINNIFNYLNKETTPSFYKFILKGRLRELVTAKSLLIFLWGNSLDLYSDKMFSEKKELKDIEKDNTIFIKDKDSLEIWNLIFKRLINKYNTNNFDIEFNNSTIILSGLKKEYIARLICNILNELDILIKNIKTNYLDKSYEEEFNSLINELKKNTIVNITDSYFRIKKDKNSISINDYLSNEFENIENDLEAHDIRTFFNPIIYNEPLKYDGKILPLYETESFKLIEEIISNWAIRTCNLLASEIFNLSSNWPELRSILINPQLQSTRNFEGFRNKINNYNRWHNNIYMPIYFYESKREYIDIVDNKFIRYFKNENREEELKNLEWLQKQVTLLVEIRDAIAPQLEIAIKYIGDIFVTILTKVIGKAIGLIGKGILQGLGRSNAK